MFTTTKETVRNEFLSEFKRLLAKYDADLSWSVTDETDIDIVVEIPEVIIDDEVVQEYCEFSIYDVNEFDEE